MYADPAIRVAPVDTFLRSAVLLLQVLPRQREFVSPPAHTLADAEQCPGSTPMAILHGDLVVGYYRVEHDARSVSGRAADSSALGLRSFQIDGSWQGHGVGSSALAVLLSDMVERHPAAHRVLLTVNCRNAAALALYRCGGFVVDAELYHGGRSGPQHLLWRDLP